APLAQAYQASSLLWMYECLRDIGSGDTVATFGDDTGAKVCALIHLVSAIAMGTEHADIVMKIGAAFWGLNGLRNVIDPSGALAAWNMKKKFPAAAQDRLLGNVKEFGTFLVSYCLFLGTQLFLEGTSPAKAWGYAIAPYFLLNLKYFFDGTYKKYGVGLEKMTPWLIFQVLTVATLLF
ncbi:MAG: hypothetical protein SGILL_007758, partial [Bacillariaceae sp.]